MDDFLWAVRFVIGSAAGVYLGWAFIQFFLAIGILMGDPGSSPSQRAELARAARRSLLWGWDDIAIPLMRVVREVW